MVETRINFEQRNFKREFQTDPPTPLTIARIRENFEADGTVQNVHKQRSGKQWSSTNAAEILVEILVEIYN